MDQTQAYCYSAQLKTIFSRNNTQGGPVQYVDGIENARFYRKPNSMDWLQGEVKDCSRDGSRQKYALIERRTNINLPLKIGYDVDSYEDQKPADWPKYISRLLNPYFNDETPDILSNSSTIVKLMNLNSTENPNQIALFEAYVNPTGSVGNSRPLINLRHGGHQFKYGIASTSYSSHLEHVLASEKRKREEEINPNKSLEALYGAKLRPNDSAKGKTIKIAFTAETDGLWEAESRNLDELTLASVVEVKSAIRHRLTTPYGCHFYYEEDILRRNWAQCRIREMKEFIFGLVEEINPREFVLNEVWLYDVTAIPRIVNELDAASGSRAFPTEMNTNPDIQEQQEALRKQKAPLKVWTENDCFDSLYKGLSTVLSSLGNCEPGTTPYKYFLRDRLTIQNHRLIDQVTAEEYSEAVRVTTKKPVLVQIFSNKRVDQPRFDRDPKITNENILSFLAKNGRSIPTEEVEELIVLRHSRGRVDEFEITFTDIKHAQRFCKWRDFKADATPDNMGIRYQKTARQKQALFKKRMN